MKSDGRNVSALDAASNRVAHSESNMQLMVNAIAICAARKAMTAGAAHWQALTQGHRRRRGRRSTEPKAASTGRARGLDAPGAAPRCRPQRRPCPSGRFLPPAGRRLPVVTQWHWAVEGAGRGPASLAGCQDPRVR